jgi:hypothetical protein
MESSAGLEQEADAAMTDQDLAQAVSQANDLLISSLSAGDIPTNDEADLNAQIAAYRASISRLTSRLGPDVAADAAAAAQPSSSRDQAGAAAAAAAAGQSDEAAHGMVPGLGREGVDYQVNTAAAVQQ